MRNGDRRTVPSRWWGIGRFLLPRRLGAVGALQLAVAQNRHFAAGVLHLAGNLLADQRHFLSRVAGRHGMAKEVIDQVTADGSQDKEDEERLELLDPA